MVERDSTVSTQDSQTWTEYREWARELNSEDETRGRRYGQWPEGTPQVFVDLETKTTPSEKLLATIFGNPPVPIKEIQERPVDYVRRQREERLSGTEEADSVADQLLKEQVHDVLARLDKRERQVLEHRFALVDGTARTQAEIGNMLGVSASTVGKIERAALEKLRSSPQP